MRFACLLGALFAFGCSSSGSPPPPAPCTMAIAADAAHDLALEGAGSCAGTVRFALRVATGDAGSPSWSDAAAAPLQVEGKWRLVPGGVARDLTVRNAGAAPVTLVGLEWATDGL